MPPRCQCRVPDADGVGRQAAGIAQAIPCRPRHRVARGDLAQLARSTLIGNALSNMAFGVFEVLGPVLALLRLGGASGWGVVSSGIVAGELLAGLVTMWYRARRPVSFGMATSVLLAAPLIALAARQPVAIVTAGAVNYDFAAESWNNGGTYTNVNGVRAPIQARFTGTVCGGGAGAGFDAAWIGIEPSSGDAVTQAGVIHLSITGGQTYCKFVASGTGTISAYDCGGLTDGNYNFFEITEYTDPLTRVNLYDVEDCNTSGWGSFTCVTKENASVHANPWALDSIETDYGQTPCTLQIMGSSSSILHLGSTGNPMQFQQGEASSWTTENLTRGGATCSDYKSLWSDTVYGTYDGRN